MTGLRERTSYIKLADGEIDELPTDGRWVNVRETLGGGARVDIGVDDLEYLDRLNTKLAKDGRVIEASVNEKDGGLILVDEKGAQIPFEEVMKALFD
jgi:hypothetical protein